MGSFTDLFIRRPVLATVVSLLILLVGAQAGFKLQIRQYPELSQTTITITTTYPGANADLIKGFITTPIEQAVASTEGIDTLVATSQQNVSVITLNMRLNASPDRAVSDVLSKIQQVKSQLPREAQDPVVVKKTGQGYALLYMSFNSDVLTSAQITDYLNRVVQPKLQTLDGVAEADSVTWDAHKSMPVSMGAGMFFCRHPEVVRGLFGVEAPYMMRGHGDDEPFLTSLQWSRRFAGLKVLLTLATQGWQGLAAGVDRQFARGERLRAGLTAAGYEVLNDTPLPVVCFTCSALRSGSVAARTVLQTLWRSGAAWISETRLAGRVQCLRACVTHVDTTDEDVDAVIAAIRAALPLPA